MLIFPLHFPFLIYCTKIRWNINTLNNIKVKTFQHNYSTSLLKQHHTAIKLTFYIIIFNFIKVFDTLLLGYIMLGFIMVWNVIFCCVFVVFKNFVLLVKVVRALLLRWSAPCLLRTLAAYPHQNRHLWDISTLTIFFSALIKG